jgi:hypothetical protein
MRARWVLRSALLGLILAFAPQAGALTLTVQQEIPLNGAPTNSEGIAVIPTGPNAGIYIPHRDDGLVTVLDATTGAFLYNFNSGIVGGNLRSIDVLDNGHLLIGQHTTNFVREVIIPANPGNGTTPSATLGTIQFVVPPHPDDGQVFDEFESLTPFRRPSDGQLFVLLGEEGRNIPVGSSNEQPGEVYLGVINETTGLLSDFDKLFSVPLGPGLDDISGLDVVDIRFDALGNLDLAGSRLIMSDDSSGGDSSAFVLDLTGMVLETLVDPATQLPTDFESLFGQAWNDAEGVDYDPATRTYTIFFSTGGGGTPEIVRFVADFEVTEPASAVLLGLGLAALALLRRPRV